jgi:hypothetical protein
MSNDSSQNEDCHLKPITKERLSMDRHADHILEYTELVQSNLERLADILTNLQNKYGKQFVLTSGWRPRSLNAQKGGSKASKHIDGLAADIGDVDGAIMSWILQNIDIVKNLGIYIEDFRWTPTWVHLQIKAPNSKKTIYIPNDKPAPAPDRWDGKY